MSFPELNKDFLSLHELAERWSNLYEQQITVDRILAHIANGSLHAMISDGRTGVKAERSDVMYPEYAYQPYPNLKVNSDQVAMIISADSYLRLNDLLEINDDKTHKLYASRNKPVTKESLVIDKDIMKSFENDSGVGVNSGLTWNDLFLSPPQRRNDAFDAIKDVVEQYIIDNSELPNMNQLWDRLTQLPDYDGKSITGLSTMPLDKDNFKGRFNNWIKPKRKQ